MWLSNDSKTNALIEPRTVKHSSNETSDFNDRLINNSFAHCFNSAHSQTKTRNDSHTDNVKAQQSQHIKPEIQILLLLQMGASNSIPLLLCLHFYNTFRVLLRTSKLNHSVVGLVLVGVDECNAVVGGPTGSLWSRDPNGILLIFTCRIIISVTWTAIFLAIMIDVEIHMEWSDLFCYQVAS